MEPMMTSPASEPSLRKRGFTLTEMIVVMGIIVLLGTILLPMLVKMYGKGKKTRAAADLQAIQVGLDAYRADFGDYPRFPQDYVVPPPPNPDNAQDRGARLLCRALLGPGPAAGALTSGFDGADGPGFRLRPSGLGKVWGPYVNAEKFKATTPLDQSAKLLDADGKIILYYPAKPGNPQVRAPAGAAVGTARGFCWFNNPTVALPAGQVVPLYNAYDNSATIPTALLIAAAANPGDIAFLLGDVNRNGEIDGAESPRFTGPYILWTPGSDGSYGLTNVSPEHPNGITDDVANFDFDSSVIKN